MKYWIMLNGVQLGPLEISEIKSLPVNANTPVWCESMTDWAPAATVPELAEIINNGTRSQPQYQQSYQGQQYQQQPNHGYQPYNQPQMQYNQPQYAPGSYRQSDPMPPMPNTYMALSIIVTILCCIVGGIIAIVYSSKVSSCYNMGDYAGAQKASKTALGWIIASACVSVIGSILYFFLFLGTAFLQNI